MKQHQHYSLHTVSTNITTTFDAKELAYFRGLHAAMQTIPVDRVQHLPGAGCTMKKDTLIVLLLTELLVILLTVMASWFPVSSRILNNGDSI